MTFVPQYTDQEKIDVLEREIGMRQTCYPKWNQQKSGNRSLTPAQARSIEILQELVAELRERARAAAALEPPKEPEPEQLELLG